MSVNQVQKKRIFWGHFSTFAKRFMWFIRFQSRKLFGDKKYSMSKYVYLLILFDCLRVVQKWRHPLREEGESVKRWSYSISLFSNMGDKLEERNQNISKNRWRHLWTAPCLHIEFKTSRQIAVEGIRNKVEVAIWNAKERRYLHMVMLALIMQKFSANTIKGPLTNSWLERWIVCYCFWRPCSCY